MAEAMTTGMVDHRPMTIVVVMVGTSEEVMEAVSFEYRFVCFICSC